MRVILFSFLATNLFLLAMPVTAAVTAGPSVSELIKVPNSVVGDLQIQIPKDFLPIEPTEAVKLDVVGATGGLTHPACVAETQRRAAAKRPPPNGDFPCVVPASNGAGTVDGMCFVHVCKGVSFTGLGGGSAFVQSISSLTSIVGALLVSLVQSGAGAESSPVVQRAASSTREDANIPLLIAESEAVLRSLLAGLIVSTTTQ